MNRKIVVITILKIIVLLAALIAALYFGIKAYNKFLENRTTIEKASIQEILPNIEKDYTYVIYEDEILELDTYPQIIEDKIYLPIDLVQEYLNANFYWDNNENVLTYTTYEDVIRMVTDELTYYVNDHPIELNMPIVEIEEKPYIPVELLLKFCEYDFTYIQETNILIIDDVDKDHRYGEVIGEEEVYVKLDMTETSKYIKIMNPGDTVRIYDEIDSWYFVRTIEGYFGYILKENVSTIITQKGKQDKYPSYTYAPNNEFEGKVSLAWHQIWSSSANNQIESKMKNVQGVDVLSPTWFELGDSEGTIINRASVEYVKWAHDNDYDVWALFSNAFNSTITHDVLSSTEKREKVIKQILALASIYDLDGINIDFENVAAADGEHFVQFIKEATPYFKSQGLIVSVDMYVPSSWTAHYNRTEVGKVVDYIVIMAYDEHWSTSPESGSVSSMGFVESGILATLEEVQKEKVILGVPFYTRLWKEQMIDSEIQVSSTALGMERAYEILVENDAEIIWDDEIGQYYGEYQIGDMTNKIWLEDDASMERRMQLLAEYDLAGVATWSLGFEKNSIWNVLYEYLKE